MLVTGLVTAIVIEWVAVYEMGRWRYTARTPCLACDGCWPLACAANTNAAFRHI